MGKSKIRKSVLTYDPKKKKKVVAGTLIDGAFWKRVKAEHFMKVEQGYGIQEDVIQRLKEMKCSTVLIATPTFTYEMSFSDWERAPIKDYGNGLQRFVKVTKPLNKSQISLNL